MPDPFALLGLPRRPWLDGGDIRAAFQKQARRSHPDAEGGSAEAFSALNTARATVASPALRLRLLAGDMAPPAMPGDIQLGFRVAEVMRKVEALRERARAADNVLVRTLLAGEARALSGEFGQVTAALDAAEVALDARLRVLDARWPDVAEGELGALAGEYIFLFRWKDQAREARLGLEIAFGKKSK